MFLKLPESTPHFRSNPPFFHSVLLHRRPRLISIGHITGHWVAIFRGWRSITPAARMRHGVAKVQEEGRGSLYHFLRWCEKHPESELRLVSNMRPTKIGMISMAWKGKVRHGSIGLFLHFWDKTYMLDLLYMSLFTNAIMQHTETSQKCCVFQQNLSLSSDDQSSNRSSNPLSSIQAIAWSWKTSMV